MGVPPPSDKPSDGSGPDSQTYHRAGRWRKPALAAAVAVLAFARWRPFRVEVTGASMRPTLEPGDWALGVVTRRRGLRTGDVVVFEHPERPGFELVKRIGGIAGDATPDGRSLEGIELWVEGDDPASSTDSRHFGPIAGDRVRGRLVLIWWPPDRVRRL